MHQPRIADLGGSVASCSASFLGGAGPPARGSGRLRVIDGSLVLSTVRSAGTMSGKCVELADFFTELRVPDKVAVKMASRRSSRHRVSTLRANYTGLVATLGSEGALRGILKSHGLLKAPS